MMYEIEACACGFAPPIVECTLRFFLACRTLSYMNVATCNAEMRINWDR